MNLTPEEAVPHPADGVKVISVTVDENKPKANVVKGLKGVLEGAGVIAVTIAVNTLDPIITTKIGGIKLGGGIAAALGLGAWRAFSNWWKHRKKNIEIELEPSSNE